MCASVFSFLLLALIVMISSESLFYKHCILYNYSALEDANPDEAVRMYADACTILEEDGKEQMAFDLYRAATSVYVKLERSVNSIWVRA